MVTLYEGTAMIEFETVWNGSLAMNRGYLFIEAHDTKSAPPLAEPYQDHDNLEADMALVRAVLNSQWLSTAEIGAIVDLKPLYARRALMTLVELHEADRHYGSIDGVKNIYYRAHA